MEDVFCASRCLHLASEGTFGLTIDAVHFQSEADGEGSGYNCIALSIILSIASVKGSDALGR
jgi:hypothetical protein